MQGEDSETYIIFALRDFDFDTVVDLKRVSPDEYLEHYLEMQIKNKKKRYGEQPCNIKTFFKKRDCYVFSTPANRRKLADIGNCKDEDLYEDFLEDLNKFRDNIIQYHPSSSKQITGSGMYSKT